jgi:hypothetical protein
MLHYLQDLALQIGGVTTAITQILRHTEYIVFEISLFASFLFILYHLIKEHFHR